VFGCTEIDEQISVVIRSRPNLTVGDTRRWERQRTYVSRSSAVINCACLLLLGAMPALAHSATRDDVSGCEAG
jgi:hypothetical protein